MAASTATVARRLPRGWATSRASSRFWIGFYFAYQLARGVADREAPRPRSTTAQGDRLPAPPGLDGRAVAAGRGRGSTVLIQATSFTYWLSQFAVVGVALLWVYFNAHERFLRFRNMLLVGNLIGLVGYVLLPTAPPRMFPDVGLRRHARAHSTINHSTTSSSSPRTRTRRCRACTRRRADRRRRDGVGRALALGEGALARLAGVGLVRGDGDRQPLLARHRRGRARRGRRRLRSCTGRGVASSRVPA